MVNAKILIIEDDNDINNLVCETLTKAGYDCAQAFSGTEGLLYAKSGNYSLIFLDLMLPGMKGELVLSELKKKNNIPVIIISAKDSTDAKINLLNLGADDYITKPFDINELVARAGALLRRYSGITGAVMSDTLRHKAAELNRTALTVHINGIDLDLTKHEFKILELLMLSPDKVFSKQEIYDYAWDDFYIGEDKTINVHISNLRKKIKCISDDEYIETVWGIGFRLKK